MKIKEVVTIEDATDFNQLYSILIDAARGKFADIVNGDDKDEISRVEKVFKDEFNQFATIAFNKGREYEKTRAITQR
jgi:hypothetical protein